MEPAARKTARKGAEEPIALRQRSRLTTDERLASVDVVSTWTSQFSCGYLTARALDQANIYALAAIAISRHVARGKLISVPVAMLARFRTTKLINWSQEFFERRRQTLQRNRRYRACLSGARFRAQNRVPLLLKRAQRSTTPMREPALGDQAWVSIAGQKVYNIYKKGSSAKPQVSAFAEGGRCGPLRGSR